MTDALDDLDLGSPEALADPWTPMRQLQDQDPVFWSASENAWIVTRYADVLSAYRDQRLSASRIMPFLSSVPGGFDEGRFPLIKRFENAWITNVDLPIHSRLRRLMAAAFTRPVVEALRPQTRKVSTAILASSAGKRLDYVHDIARELPAQVVAEMFGIPDAQRNQFADWAGKIQKATGAANLTQQMIADYHDTLAEMNVELTKLIEERRAEPREDLLTQFVQARDDGDRLTDDELLGACHATIIAGFETTMHMLTLGMIELAERPQLCDYARESEANMNRTVDELLRYVGMVKGMLRIARQDFSWHDKQIKTGDFVFAMNISANRDPRIWERPDEVLPDRDNKLSLAFAPGMHFCLGHLLARMELAEFFTELFAKYDIEILTHDRTYINSFTFRGLEQLPVKITRK